MPDRATHRFREAHFAARADESPKMMRDARGVIPRRALMPDRAVEGLSWIVFGRDDKEGGSKIFLEVEVAIELDPEIFDQAEMNEWKRQRSHPINGKMFERPPAPAIIDEGTDRCPVKKPEHRVIELVMANPGMIDIVCEAGDETVSRRDWGDLEQRDAIANNQVAEQSDMQLERRYSRIGDWLAMRK